MILHIQSVSFVIYNLQEFQTKLKNGTKILLFSILIQVAICDVIKKNESEDSIDNLL